MTLDIADAGRYVFYVNFRRSFEEDRKLEGEVPGGRFCEVEQNFNFANLIEDASKYVVSIDRFRVPIQGLTMVAAIINAIQLVPKAAAPPVNFDLLDTYSLNEFLEQVNTVLDPDLQIRLSADGRVRLTFTRFNDYTIRLNQKIADIFGMEINLDAVGTQTFVGSSPIFDRFDDVYKVQIEAQTGLSGIQQEIVDTNTFRNILTDFLLPSPASMSYNGTPTAPHDSAYVVSYPVRQDLEFNDSSNRRFIMLKGNAPIQNIRLECVAILRDGTRQRIPLPPRGVFEVKLAFWRKSA